MVVGCTASRGRCPPFWGSPPRRSALPLAPVDRLRPPRLWDTTDPSKFSFCLIPPVPVWRPSISPRRTPVLSRIRRPATAWGGLALDRGTEVALAAGDPCGPGRELRRTGLHAVSVADRWCRCHRHCTRACPIGEPVRRCVVQSGVAVVDGAPSEHQPGRHDRLRDPGSPGAVRRAAGPESQGHSACRHPVTAAQAAAAPRLRIKSRRRGAETPHGAACRSAVPSRPPGVVAPHQPCPLAPSQRKSRNVEQAPPTANAVTEGQSIHHNRTR